MLTHLDPASTLAFGLLVFALIMVILFEATNGFHDAANAVATVIYTCVPGSANSCGKSLIKLVRNHPAFLRGFFAASASANAVGKKACR
jgi:hypothetical protein